jgi:crotonobetainyl-CoA:carnitine CoA-transferase CaiB-like acyl-CoA transferase
LTSKSAENIMQASQKQRMNAHTLNNAASALGPEANLNPAQVSSPSLPLQGITVIELGHSVAAPFAAQTLSDLGAEVWKIEKPEGDDARRWAPPYLAEASAVFQCLNRNKRSVSCNLRDPSSLQALKLFIQDRVDVVLQNLRPGQVQVLGLDAENLRAGKPSLIYCNIGAFGELGPMAKRPGYDPLMQAFSGIMSVTGEEGRPPVRVGPSIIDMGTGSWAVIGILAALLERKQSGKGTVVDVSLFETAASLMTIPAAQYQGSGEVPTRQGSGSKGIVPYRAYLCSDQQYLVISAGSDGLFKRLASVLGEPQWAEDPRFSSNPQRVIHEALIYSLIEARMLQRSSSQWQQLLDEAGIPCAPVQSTEQLLDHPQMAAMGLLQSIPDANYQTIGLPLRLNGERPKSRSPAPALGEANAQWQRMTDSILRAGQHTSEALTEPSQFNIADYASNHRKTTP